MIGNTQLAHLVIWYLVFLFSTTFHEFAHAWAAYRGGDRTAHEGGQVSLDPLPHIRRSPFGMVVVPLISFLQLGWMIGWASTPFDSRWGDQFPRRQALMSLAGPLANLSLATAGIVALKALIAAGIFRVADVPTFTQLVQLVADEPASSPKNALAMALSVLVNLNVLLGLFNLLPIPPLDGAGVLQGAAPKATRGFFDKLRETPMLEMAGLMLAWYVFPFVARPALSFVFGVALSS
jgi:Zn-dependent protease